MENDELTRRDFVSMTVAAGLAAAAGANGPIYKKDDAERAWAKLMALYKSALV